jgi:DtxR family Mn-dependent transcriptional regulator
VTGDRQLALSETGRALATRVMRKHRLAECLLVDVIKLPWEEVHIEACRWEHVISESVERRLFEMLGHPERCPHGNVIPGVDELLAGSADPGHGADHDQAMTDVASEPDVHVTVSRISEQIQSDLVLMLKLKRAGIQPGREVLLGSVKGGVRVTSADGGADVITDLESQVASHVFVSRE